MRLMEARFPLSCNGFACALECVHFRWNWESALSFCYGHVFHAEPLLTSAKHALAEHNSMASDRRQTLGWPLAGIRLYFRNSKRERHDLSLLLFGRAPFPDAAPIFWQRMSGLLRLCREALPRSWGRSCRRRQGRSSPGSHARQPSCRGHSCHRPRDRSRAC